MLDAGAPKERRAGGAQSLARDGSGVSGAFTYHGIGLQKYRQSGMDTP